MFKNSSNYDVDYTFLNFQGIFFFDDDFSKGEDSVFNVYTNVGITYDKSIYLYLNAFGLKSPKYQTFSIEKVTGEIGAVIKESKESYAKFDSYYIELKSESGELVFRTNSLDAVKVSWQSISPTMKKITHSQGSILADADNFEFYSGDVDSEIQGLLETLEGNMPEQLKTRARKHLAKLYAQKN